MLAPPWIPVPPPAYGGIESVIATLTQVLVAHGHNVTLFAPPGSRSSAAVRHPLNRPYPNEIGGVLYEVDHVARAFSALDAEAEAGLPFDVVHDHCSCAALAMADRLATPLVHTLHGPFTGAQVGFYAAHGEKATLVAISHAQLRQAPEHLRHSPVVPNPVVVDQWPLCREKDDFLLWIGRVTDDKGPQRAIHAARLAGRRLVMAGPVQRGQEDFFAAHVEPRINGSSVRYVGEVGGKAKADLIARAAGLLMPIRWPEPFGMVMVEALACGTPVVAFPEGSAPEIVIHGENGFLVHDEAEMAEAVETLSEIDPDMCRATAASRYDVEIVAEQYEAVYRECIANKWVARAQYGAETAAVAAEHEVVAA